MIETISFLNQGSLRYGLFDLTITRVEINYFQEYSDWDRRHILVQ